MDGFKAGEDVFVGMIYKPCHCLQDDQQQPIAAGDYVVHIEVVREHGGRDYLKQPITFGQDAVAHHLAPTAETGVITLTYQP